MSQQYIITLDEAIVRADPEGMMQRLAIPGVHIRDFLQTFFMVIAVIDDTATVEVVRGLEGVLGVDEDRNVQAL
jgi:hypothetical protein